MASSDFFCELYYTFKYTSYFDIFWIICILYSTGCWYTYPSEKYESQLGLLFPIYGKKQNVPNHQPESVLIKLYHHHGWCPLAQPQQEANTNLIGDPHTPPASKNQFRISNDQQIATIWFCIGISGEKQTTIGVMYLDMLLVGGIPTPLKKMSSSVGIMNFPIYGKIKFMFQTTN